MRSERYYSLSATRDFKNVTLSPPFLPTSQNYLKAFCKRSSQLKDIKGIQAISSIFLNSRYPILNS